MTKWLRFGAVGICLVGLVYIRFRESVLFYDPLLEFFKGNYNTTSLPDLDLSLFFISTASRFLINTVLSLSIIALIFREKGVVKLAALLFAIVGIICLVLLYLAITNYEVGESMFLFYVRRFLIQPLLLLVLVPAFYYHKKQRA